MDRWVIHKYAERGITVEPDGVMRMSPRAAAVYEGFTRAVGDAFAPRPGILTPVVARTIDERDCEPLRPEDADWGEDGPVMGSDRISWVRVSDEDEAPALLAAARARVAELEAENAALRAGLDSRDETIARLTRRLHGLEMEITP
jgi:hypothetical protein